MQELLSSAKELLIFVNLFFIVLVVPIYRYIKASIHSNIELQKTLKKLNEEIALLRRILFDIADAETIKRHIKDAHTRDI